VDPKHFFSDPEPTCRVIKDPVPGPNFQAITDLSNTEPTFISNVESGARSRFFMDPTLIFETFLKILWICFLPYRLKSKIYKFRPKKFVFLYYEAWSGYVTIILQPDPDVTFQVIKDPDLEPAKSFGSERIQTATLKY